MSHLRAHAKIPFGRVTELANVFGLQRLSNKVTQVLLAENDKIMQLHDKNLFRHPASY
jgi:hypothetical protein